MKVRISLMPAMLLALAISGCKQPTHPTFAPDSRTLVFEKGGDLYLRSGGSEKRIGKGVEGDPAWSNNGRKLAFYVNGGNTFIRDARSGKQTRIRGFGFPYAWTPEGLFATDVRMKQDGDWGVVIDPASGKILHRINLPINPQSAGRAGDSVLIWNTDAAFLVDSRSARPIRALNGLDPVTRNPSGTEWVFARKYATPHSRRHLVDLVRWETASPEKVSVIETLDPGSDRPGVTYVVDVQGSLNGSLASLVVELEPNAADAADLYSLIDQYDLLNHLLDNRHPMSDVDNEWLSKIVDRSSFSVVVRGRRPGGRWVDVYRHRETQNDSDGMTFFDLSPDGSSVAVSHGSGTRVYPLK